MYFKIFPKTFYTFDFKNQSPKVVTDIFNRFKIKSTVLTNALAFYKYQVLDGDTPEIISSKVYGSPMYHWVICLSNDIIDPQFDLPLNSFALEKKILDEYGYTSISEAMAATHHYELVVTKLITQVDGFANETTEKSEISLQQYDYTSNTIVTKTLNNPVTETVEFRANNADPESALVSTYKITSTYREVNVYDYEIAKNEQKRQIKILKKQFIPLIVEELENNINARS